MLRPNKSGTSSNMAPITTLPRVELLAEMLTLLRKNFRAPVNLEISVSGRRFMLSVSAGSPDPHWTLYSDQQLLWEMPATDVEMVTNMTVGAIEGVLAQNRGGISNDSVGTYQQQQAPFSAAQKSAPDPMRAYAPSAQPTPQAAPVGGVTLAGDVAKVELANVIQSVSICRMTGRLIVDNKLEFVELYFEDGNFVHAVLGHSLHDETQTGDHVIIELLMWEDGNFNFQPSVTSSERSAKRRIDSLLMEGATLTDHRNYLNKNKIRLDSVLQKFAWISEADFDATVAKGIPVKTGEQKRVFLEVDGRKSLEEIIKKYNLPRRDWIPIVFNLVNLELVCLPHTTGTVPAFGYEEQLQLENAWEQIMAPETKVLPVGLFMHLYGQEFTRAKKCGGTAKFTVAVFDIVYKNGDTYDLAIPPTVARDVLTHLRHELNEIDFVGHFYSGGYAVVFPFEDTTYASHVIEKFLARLQREQSSTPFDLKNIRVAVGAATAPSHSSDPEMLLRFAHKAKAKAQKEGRSFEIASGS